MHCHAPEQVPVISTLARQFAVCTRWFCSVPGETWPNRNFVHAATSDGETNIQIRTYSDKTIFELLEEAGRDWHIYHDDTPQVWAFDALWREDRMKNWFSHDRFAAHVAADTLPAYSFMEPNHRPVVHTLDHEPVIGSPDVSTSQHPGNNLVSNDAYDSYTDDGNTDFARGEQLIASVYETLRTHPEVFEKTLLVLTYDEHGGLYDHVPPPTDVPAPNDPRGWGAKVMAWVFQRKHEAFDFTMLGPRVPTLLISPWISASTVDQTVRDHASVPATLRALFAPESEPLTERDRWSPPFHGLVNRAAPRRGDELPDLSGLAAGHASVLAEMQRPDGTPAATSEPPYLPSYYTEFAEMTEHVAGVLGKRPTPAADADPAAGTRIDGLPLHAVTARVTNAFEDEARRLRLPLVPAQAAPPPETAPRIPTEH
jgi:phospholipase C